MRKPGENLQRLVAFLEKQLTEAKIESPYRLRDKITGRMREHDVVIFSKNGHHDLIIAIECRDRSRPIGVGQVEEFSTKCNDTGVNSGIIASSKGFYTTALLKAEKKGILCFSIEQDNIDGWAITSIPEPKVSFTRTYVIINFSGPSKDSYKIFNRLNKVASIEDFSKISLEKINDRGNHKIGSFKINFKIKGDEFSAFDNNGEKIPITSIEITSHYTVDINSIPLIMQKYVDVTNSKLLARIATAELDDNGELSKILFVNHGEKYSVSNQTKSRSIRFKDLRP
ncbi:restriction endonuclease [Sphingosinicella sp.]|uniref:restriction endonuclease n=1 Tax=Sphingosinicella sp. TaxID=1917971 RepID=UPI001851D58E|nr:restriction endonuclease [Sphingosinicella sp.]MBA4757398.1 restriction endonuclease [Sphingosinicella sp.]